MNKQFKSVKRYNPSADDTYVEVDMVADERGLWVRYKDYERATTELQAELKEKRAAIGQAITIIGRLQEKQEDN